MMKSSLWWIKEWVPLAFTRTAKVAFMYFIWSHHTQCHRQKNSFIQSDSVGYLTAHPNSASFNRWKEKRPLPQERRNKASSNTLSDTALFRENIEVSLLWTEYIKELGDKIITCIIARKERPKSQGTNDGCMIVSSKYLEVCSLEWLGHEERLPFPLPQLPFVWEAKRWATQRPPSKRITANSHFFVLNRVRLPLPPPPNTHTF